MREKFHWPGMRKDIANYIKSCEQCESNKITRQKPAGKLQKLREPSAPGQMINMDFITDLPYASYRGRRYNSIWVIVDRFSRRTYAFPVRDTCTAEEFLELYMHEFVFKVPSRRF